MVGSPRLLAALSAVSSAVSRLLKSTRIRQPQRLHGAGCLWRRLWQLHGVSAASPLRRGCVGVKPAKPKKIRIFAVRLKMMPLVVSVVICHVMCYSTRPRRVRRRCVAPTNNNTRKPPVLLLPEHFDATPDEAVF